jgi:acetyl esterase/lipase
VRLYQAIEAAGGTAKLDVYEGMPHVFQGQIPNAPESRLAVAKMKAFFDQHLAR